MARIVITRPNGETEYAELTTDKSLVGSHYLTVERDGTPYYAKLGDSVSTHLCVEGSDGKKRYVQKFVWKYTFNDTWENASKMVIPHTGKYRLTFTCIAYGANYIEADSKIFSKDDIFNQGSRFYIENDAHKYWTLKAKSGKKYLNMDSSDNGQFPDPSYFLVFQTHLTSIEYIGEA
ncbi:hypothetical protein HMPREF3191_00871 [Veillonellaceae bacterium DNF00626]|nr:hypothetical protein HMPREF3191_00871 [Veillonellaceae bacterium DNF00626]